MTHKTYIILILISTLTFINCSSSKKAVISSEVIYDAHTRGRFEKITLTSDNLTYKTRQNSEIITISEEQKNSLNKEISKIELNKIDKLTAPTNKRLHDGAMHTFISIKQGEELYTSITFDDTNPPAELLPLCNLIKSFIKK
ncbi:hypothetical protein [Tenacibaculum aquimarinum]|uniref:hypothetical protein n=1 Tax=Tenacibaculum aquimarinum TaxID=2910675 RepID=UPI001F0B61F1|nr:hypothetical protein [Tenacibaculum aquimarinum]MCH3884235.1 hypothetical protein [Tenacibaculum aquimarinum]